MQFLESNMNHKKTLQAGNHISKNHADSLREKPSLHLCYFVQTPIGSNGSTPQTNSVGVYGGFLKLWYPSTQQPWIFLVKMIILGCFGGTTIFGNTHIRIPIIKGGSRLYPEYKTFFFFDPNVWEGSNSMLKHMAILSDFC